MPHAEVMPIDPNSRSGFAALVTPSKAELEPKSFRARLMPSPSKVLCKGLCKDPPYICCLELNSYEPSAPSLLRWSRGAGIRQDPHPGEGSEGMLSPGSPGKSGNVLCTTTGLLHGIHLPHLLTQR